MVYIEATSTEGLTAMYALNPAGLRQSNAHKTTRSHVFQYTETILLY